MKSDLEGLVTDVGMNSVEEASGVPMFHPDCLCSNQGKNTTNASGNSDPSTPKSSFFHSIWFHEKSLQLANIKELIPEHGPLAPGVWSCI